MLDTIVSPLTTAPCMMRKISDRSDKPRENGLDWYKQGKQMTQERHTSHSVEMKVHLPREMLHLALYVYVPGGL